MILLSKRFRSSGRFATPVKPGKRAQAIRVGFTYNVKRSPDGDDEAEWDPPETIIAIANALARQAPDLRVFERIDESRAVHLGGD